eukprot:CAMPEP_0118855384 /NCGR_PEP_ID=MMETSP1163-20130328/3231_1 /TAXON_ID=124430 /ORGANISM="Phaeomonas parva, Strain CCMP2877" /LENGTH=655 /DNA_ID=CAMNT_0006788265 /DNA_START=120 /DNA_END=2087 /DNA_ORIENTATION=+
MRSLLLLLLAVLAPRAQPFRPHLVRRSARAAASPRYVVEKEKDTEAETETSGGPSKNDQEWRFFDVATIWVEGGHGGDGCVSFRREAMVAFGGPNGGNGGDGGSVILECDPGLNTLAPLRRKVHWRGGSGRNGHGKSRHAPKMPDVVIPVPPGTMVRQHERDGGKLAGELTHPGQRLVVALGGKGGRGNEAFKSNRYSAPKLCELGAKGGQRWLQVELKLVADVGLLGVPNAGKSTFLSRVSNAKPKIADYAFTTITPNLGVVDLSDKAGDDGAGNGLVVCDIPGIIEGAHEGVGLGQAFLRHVERCRVLLHLVDGSAEDPVENYRVIQNELRLFSPKLAEKPQVVLLNKCDMPEVAARKDELLRELYAAAAEAGDGHSRFMAASALTGDNAMELMYRVGKLVNDIKAKDAAPEYGPTATEGEDALKYEYRERGERSINTIDLEAYDRGEVPFDDEEDYLEGKTSGIQKIQVTRGTNRRRGRAATPSRFAVHSSPVYPGQFRIVGREIERIANTTAWDYPEAAKRFQRIMLDMGVGKTLVEAGAEADDLIMVGDFDFEFDETIAELASGGRSRMKGYEKGVAMMETQYMVAEEFDDDDDDFDYDFNAEDFGDDEDVEVEYFTSGMGEEDEDGDSSGGGGEPPQVDWTSVFGKYEE